MSLALLRLIFSPDFVMLSTQSTSWELGKRGLAVFSYCVLVYESYWLTCIVLSLTHGTMGWSSLVH